MPARRRFTGPGLRRRLLGGTAAVGALLALPGGAASADAVTLQLRWDHQFQFAGYYAALWQGFYEENGLDVEIRSALTPDGDVLKATREVAEGRAEFGIGSADILLQRARGHDLRVVSSIFQQSGIVFATLADRRVSSLVDLVDMTVSWRPGGVADMEFRALMHAEGIDLGAIEHRPLDPTFQGLFEGEADLTASYRLSIEWFAEQAGVPVSTTSAASYGVDFYGDSLFTHQRVIDADPGLVDRFVEATHRGWEYALTHPEEMAQAVAGRLERTVPVDDPLAFARFQAPIVKDLTLYPLVEIGDLDPERWQRMHDYMSDAGLLPEPVDVDALLHDPALIAQARRERITTFLQLGTILALGLTAGAIAWIVMLRRAVAARTQELLQERDSAELANRAKSEFLNNVSHELRTPLNAILGFSELFREQLLGPVGNDRYVGYARDIHSSGQLLLQTVNELLDIARIESGRMEFRLEPLDIRPVTESALESARAEARGRGLVIEERIPPGVPPVLGDGRALKQILMNLLSNAVKFTPPGGRITLEAAPGGSETLVLTVRDTGVGIAPEHLARVTEPFTRVENQFTRSHEGTGLGLPIARLLAEGLKGKLRIASRLGRGTAVEIELGLAPDAEPWPATPMSGAEAARPREAPGLGHGVPASEAA